MCSIYGIMYFDDISSDILNEKIDVMQGISKHRGPDQTNRLIFDNVAIGMNRLSIIAPNENSIIQSSQEDQLYAIQNGEITNYRHLRSILSKKPVQKCDSAIILPLFKEFGQEFISKMAGMFAISIYDLKNNSLQLWRDPLGIKPLYYHCSDKYVIFASELKMIYAVLDKKPTLDFAAIDHILKYRLQPGCTTVFNEIQKVLPGETIIFKNKKAVHRRYWELKPNRKSLTNNKIEEFRDLFSQVIKENFYADVHGGFFTSGGLDSSLVTAVSLKEQASSYTQPISIRFSPNPAIDEKYGALLEGLFNKKFEWVTITDELARKTLMDLVPYLDEPLENPTHVGTYLMSKRAKELGIKSIITGDGADEFFLGYERHACWFNNPDPVSAYPALNWTMTPDEAVDLYKNETNLLLKPMVNGYNREIIPIVNMDQALLYERGERLPEYHNMRLDRMTMAHGIEAKVPFLDHRIVEFSLEIPLSTLFGNSGKGWLQQVAKKWLPNEIINRPKVLFPSLPDQWISGDVIKWTSDILLDTSAKISTYLESSVLEQYLKQHQTKEACRGKLLWALVSLELWIQNLDAWRKN